MLNKKGSKRSTLLLVAGLLILSVFLAACDTATDSVEIPFGLRAESSDSLVEIEAAAGSEIAQTTADDGAGTPAEAAASVQPAVSTAGNRGLANQAQIADRSAHNLVPTTAVAPNAAEIESLVYMREEEKLARDVYLALYDLWGMPVFQNIAASEQAHMDSIAMLLEQYELADPAAGKDVGEFTNPLFQTLYLQLLEQGSQSLAEALKVGAAIEELDIVDLEKSLAQTGNETIIQVYSNLLAGSENHLRAFVTNLERQAGEFYQPIYLNQAAYQAIINGAAARGNGNGGSGGGNGAGGNGNGRRNGQGRGA